jgi:PadR family transcriptional regulator, regulatory protein PadR
MRVDSVSGYTDLLLLAAVRSSPGGHGYAIIEELRRKSQGRVDLPEGSVYPMLRRLEEDGLVRSKWTTVDGRKRRVYTLSATGRKALGEREEHFRQFVAAVVGILDR